MTTPRSELTVSLLRRTQQAVSSSLALKLALSFIAVAVGALCVALVATTYGVRKAAEKKIDEHLGHTLEAFQHLVGSDLERLADEVRIRSRDKTFLSMALGSNSEDAEAGLGDEDSELHAIEDARETILSADTEVFGWRGSEAGACAFFNARRRLVLTHGDQAQYGAEVDEPLLEQALRSGVAVALWSPAHLRALPFTLVPRERIRDRDLLLVHASVVTDTGGESTKERPSRPIGLVLAGQWVTDLLAGLGPGSKASLPTEGQVGRPRAERAQVVDFAFRALDGALATSLQPGSPLEQPGFSASRTPLVPIRGERHLVREAALLAEGGAPIGQVFALCNLDAEVHGVIEEFWTTMGPAAVAVILCALAAAVLLARRLSSPLVQLEIAARRVRLGELSVSVPVQGVDEVGRLSGAFNEMVDGLRQRDEIKGLFKRYLAPEVVEELLRNPAKAAPGGERKELSVLFCDLVGFTSLSERLEPEALVELLNGYFERATQVLTRHGATLDKFIGDAIMCFWNAPLPQEDHAERACLTALELLAVVDGLAPEMEARGLPRLECRVGLNTGWGVAGNIGSRQAQDYTVMGDTVNLASRLEGAAKVYGTRTLVAEETVRAAGGVVLARELDLLRVKGRTTPVRVYELVGRADLPPPAYLATFAEALALYRRRRFEQALGLFLSLPGDPPSRVFAERCRTLLHQPPSSEWEGIFVLDTK
jgi:adenylate cyclase